MLRFGVPASQKQAALDAAFAVPHVEIGLASMLKFVFGGTVAAYRVALLIDQACLR